MLGGTLTVTLEFELYLIAVVIRQFNQSLSECYDHSLCLTNYFGWPRLQMLIRVFASLIQAVLLLNMPSTLSRPVQDLSEQSLYYKR